MIEVPKTKEMRNAGSGENVHDIKSHSQKIKCLNTRIKSHGNKSTKYMNIKNVQSDYTMIYVQGAYIVCILNVSKNLQMSFTGNTNIACVCPQMSSQERTWIWIYIHHKITIYVDILLFDDHVMTGSYYNSSLLVHYLRIKYN